MTDDMAMQNKLGYFVITLTNVAGGWTNNDPSSTDYVLQKNMTIYIRDRDE